MAMRDAPVVHRLCLAACCGACVLAACASQTPQSTAGLGDRLPLVPGQFPGTLVYRSPQLQVGNGKYKSVLVDNADIYRGSDGQFDGASETDKARLAAKLTSDFRNALAKGNYPLADQPGQGVV